VTFVALLDHPCTNFSGGMGYVAPQQFSDGSRFIILVAVDSDYNLLLIARVKEELHAGLDTGLIRALRAVHPQHPGEVVPVANTGARALRTTSV
jgi:hypothetical protein